MTEIKKKIEDLVTLLNKYQDAYYQGRPFVSDAEFDALYDELLELEKANPEFVVDYSPSRRVGSDLDSNFEEVAHSIPVLSLDKAYSIEEIITWTQRCAKNSGLDCVAEQKIDGISIVLYYENGHLQRALTRGNGTVGSDVTENVRTIRDIPLQIHSTVNLAVRGEIYLPIEAFKEVNNDMDVPYANPRNLTAGTIRRKKSSDVAKVPLRCFCYEGFSDDLSFDSHEQMLGFLKDQGMPLNTHNQLIHVKSSVDLEDFIQQQTTQRSSLEYEIDGLVFKVDNLDLREDLGYTGHHPRWAIAYKFDAPKGQSTVLAIDVQIGRTGRATPVARIEPVEVGGSVISNATLHNQDYISGLELSIGDSVVVSKRGDVIPAIEEVVEKSEHPLWHMPNNCPVCDTEFIIDGAHHFCPNQLCPDQLKARIQFFAGKKQMDIENLGGETLEFLWNQGFVRDIADIYEYDYKKLDSFPGFGDKKIALIQAGIEESKKRPFQQLLWSLGIPDLGPKAVELLFNAGYRSISDYRKLGEQGDYHVLQEIHGIGEKTAKKICDAFKDENLLTQISRLEQAGFILEGIVEELKGDSFTGTSWCVTGSFENFKPRSKAADLIKSLGGTIVSSVSSKTSYLLAGEKAGSKLEKAQKNGVTVLSEEEFIQKIQAADLSIDT